MEIFELNIPLYQQIVALLKRDIVSGVYRAGSKVPSIRDMAEKYEVTPNTIQRALQILENEKLIFTERTNGKFVTLDTQIIDRLRSEILSDKIRNIVSELKPHNYSDEEIRNCIEKELMHSENE